MTTDEKILGSHGSPASGDPIDPPSTSYLQGLIAAQRCVVESCVACDGSGQVIEIGTTYGHACDGTDAQCAQMCPVPVPCEVAERCEYCGRPSDAISAEISRLRGEALALPNPPEADEPSKQPDEDHGET